MAMSKPWAGTSLASPPIPSAPSLQRKVSSSYNAAPRTLEMYARAMKPTERSGTLHIRKHDRGDPWEPRYCTLKDGKFHLYVPYPKGSSKLGNGEFQETIDMTDVQSLSQPEAVRNTDVGRFIIRTLGGQYEFKAANRDEMNDWLFEFQRTIASQFNDMLRTRQKTVEPATRSPAKPLAGSLAVDKFPAHPPVPPRRAHTGVASSLPATSFMTGGYDPFAPGPSGFGAGPVHGGGPVYGGGPLHNGSHSSVGSAGSRGSRVGGGGGGGGRPMKGPKSLSPPSPFMHGSYGSHGSHGSHGSASGRADDFRLRSSPPLEEDEFDPDEVGALGSSGAQMVGGRYSRSSSDGVGGGGEGGISSMTSSGPSWSTRPSMERDISETAVAGHSPDRIGLGGGTSATGFSMRGMSPGLSFGSFEPMGLDTWGDTALEPVSTPEEPSMLEAPTPVVDKPSEAPRPSGLSGLDSAFGQRTRRAYVPPALRGKASGGATGDRPRPPALSRNLSSPADIASGRRGLGGGGVIKSKMAREREEQERRRRGCGFGAEMHGIWYAQGSRPTMEDEHVVIENLGKALGNSAVDGIRYFAVFDGHAGISVATYASQHVHHHAARSPSFAASPSKALAEALASVDVEVQKLADENPDDRKLRSGCVALAAVVDPKSRRLHVANLGDCRLVICRGGKAIQVTTDHTPETERGRIEEAGGWVTVEREMSVTRLKHMNFEDAFVRECVTRMLKPSDKVKWNQTHRVNGELSVSRALGDVDYKGARMNVFDWLWPEEGPREFKSDLVSNQAETHDVLLDESDVFMVMACDGLWDVLENQMVVDLVKQFIREAAVTAKEAARRLVDLAQRLGTTDNVTCLIVVLDDSYRCCCDSSDESEDEARRT